MPPAAQEVQAQTTYTSGNFCCSHFMCVTAIAAAQLHHSTTILRGVVLTPAAGPDEPYTQLVIPLPAMAPVSYVTNSPVVEAPAGAAAHPPACR